MNTSPVSIDADVVIVGAGVAGASAAAVLARKGVRVMLIDSRQTYPACFMAEKIEPDQAQLFRKFGLMEGLLPFASRINEVISARSGEVIRVLHLEQYGIFYQNIVNAIRAQIASTVTWKIGRVLDIVPGPDVSRLTLMGGETIAARLIVLACGLGGNLQAGLGIHKRMIREGQSFAIGFNISRENGQPFLFDALTYYPDGIATRIAFLTLFPIRDVMRANFFVYRSPGEEWVKRFKQEPHEELMRALPELVRLTGPYRITSRVEMCPVDLYGVSGHIQPGLVLIGDAYQSVCPTTGSGLSKVLTDVDVLSECVPKWLQTPGMGNEKLSDYYAHPRKTACDTKSIRTAQYCRALSTNSSFLWQIHRELRYFGVRLLGWAKHSTTVTTGDRGTFHMLKDRVINTVVCLLRKWAGRFVFTRYVGQDGCINAAMAFMTWNQVEGNYLEFGVWKGRSFAAAYHAQMYNRGRHLALAYDTPEYRRWKENRPRFFAFDSFEGLPGGPGERHVDYHEGSYQCPEDRFRTNLVAAGVDLKDVVTVPGYYDKSLNAETKDRYGLRKAAVVMIDCDLYESTVPVLDFITDLVGQGTILIFDDWFRFRGSPECGEQRACREWLAKNPQIELIEYWREGPQAVSFLVNMKSRP